MDKSDKTKASQARQDRLGKALRDNLKKRKAQARGRDQLRQSPDDRDPGQGNGTRLSPQSRPD